MKNTKTDQRPRDMGLNEATGDFRIGDISLTVHNGDVVLKRRDRVIENAGARIEGLLFEEFFAEDARDNNKKTA